MKKFLERMLHAVHAARQQRVQRLVAELNPHMLRDIGFGDEYESARLEAVRRSLRFGLY